MAKKSQLRIKEVEAWNERKSFPYPGSRIADYLNLRNIANFSKDKKHKKKFRKMAGEAKRDQAICCAQYQTYKEEYDKNGYCKFHTLNLGHRCMS